MKTQSAAIVTIRQANTMTKKGRTAIAAWLRRQAQFLEEDGDQFASRFTARYLCR